MLKIGEVKTLRDVVIKKCGEYSKNIAFVVKNAKDEFINISYEKLKQDVVALATALTSKYKLAGSKIAVIGENSYKWYMSYMAITTGVGIVVPLDKELPEAEIETLIKRAKAKCIICSHKKSETVLKIISKLKQKIMCIDMDKEKNDEQTYALDEVIKEGNKLRLAGDMSYEKQPLKQNDFRVLLFTSGTTATAKGVMLSHKNIIANLEGALSVMRVTAKDRFFSVLPMHHVYESIVTCMYGIVNGASIAICSSLKNFASEIKQAKPTILVGVPLLLNHVKIRIDKTIEKAGKTKLVENMVNVTNKMGKLGYKLKRTVFKQIHQSLGGRLKYVLVSAAPVPLELIQAYEGYGFTIFQGYGMSEAAPLISATRIENRKAGTVGQASNCEIKIEAKKGEIGEILVKGPNVMLGYYEDELATKETLKNGWLHTGDLGYFDQDDNLVIAGRCKSVIVTPNGKNIYPEELEEQINKFQEIKDVLVYGEDENNDTVLTAVVTLDDEYVKENYGEISKNSKIREIIWNKIKELNRKMVSYKAIKRIKIRFKDFEKTTTLKIKRFLNTNKEGE